MYQEDMEIVRQNILFKELEREAADEVFGKAEGYEKDFSKSQILFQEGDLVKQIGILIKGEVRVCRLEFDGGEKLIQKLRVPYLVGADVVCTPRQVSPYTAYVSEESRIWYFPYENLKNPGKLPEEARRHMKERLLEFIANENIRKLYQVDMLSAAGAREKILKYLMIQCHKAGSRQIEIPYNREELASFLCMNRTVLSHTLSKMEKEGMISFKKKQVFGKRIFDGRPGKLRNEKGGAGLLTIFFLSRILIQYEFLNQRKGMKNWIRLVYIC